MRVVRGERLMRDLAAGGLAALLAEAPPRRRRALSADDVRLGAMVLDVLQLVLGGMLATAMPGDGAGSISPAQAAGLAGLAGGVAILLGRALRLEQRGAPPVAGPLRRDAWQAVAATAITIAVVGAIVALPSPAPGEALAWIGAWFLVSVPCAAAIRCGGAALAGRLDGAATQVVVVGPPEQARPLGAAVRAQAAGGWRLAAELRAETPAELLQLRRMVEGGGADLVILAMSGSGHAQIRTVCEALADSPVRICLGLDVAALPAGLPLAPFWHRGLPLIDLVADPHGGPGGALKRGLDVLASAAALLALSPLLLAIALAVKLETPGPVLFRQRRFGIGNAPIEVLKFRSMRADQTDPTGERRTTAQDSRVTRLGRVLRRTSLDELPQLLNVLRGDMSLVGPRPHALHMKVGGRYYFEAVERYRFRHRVKPGITGWAQVNGSRGEIDTLDKARRRVELDLGYIQNWSLALDLRILLRTILGGFRTRAD